MADEGRGEGGRRNCLWNKILERISRLSPCFLDCISKGREEPTNEFEARLFAHNRCPASIAQIQLLQLFLTDRIDPGDSLFRDVCSKALLPPGLLDKYIRPPPPSPVSVLYENTPASSIHDCSSNVRLFTHSPYAYYPISSNSLLKTRQ